MKKFVSLIGAPLLFIALLFVTGCSTTQPNISPALVQQGVFTVAAYTVAKEPAVVPYLNAATPVICSAAQGTNGIDPASVVAAIEASPLASQLKTPEAVLALNGALTLYIGVWDSYGGKVDLAAMQPYLQATCNGLTLALPAAKSKPAKTAKASWPLVRYP